MGWVMGVKALVVLAEDAPSLPLAAGTEAGCYKGSGGVTDRDY